MERELWTMDYGPNKKKEKRKKNQTCGDLQKFCEEQNTKHKTLVLSGTFYWTDFVATKHRNKSEKVKIRFCRVTKHAYRFFFLMIFVEYSRSDKTLLHILLVGIICILAQNNELRRLNLICPTYSKVTTKGILLISMLTTNHIFDANSTQPRYWG